MKFDNCFTSELYSLAEEIKRETFELDNIKKNPHSFVSPSAYDTAWLAMIEDIDTQKPMFQGCLDCILSNQNFVEGIWGRHGDENGDETLTSTLACVVALRKWNIGSLHVHKGNRYGRFRLRLNSPFFLHQLDENYTYIKITCIMYVHMHVCCLFHGQKY